MTQRTNWGKFISETLADLLSQYIPDFVVIPVPEGIVSADSKLYKYKYGFQILGASYSEMKTVVDDLKKNQSKINKKFYIHCIVQQIPTNEEELSNLVSFIAFVDRKGN